MKKKNVCKPNLFVVFLEFLFFIKIKTESKGGKHSNYQAIEFRGIRK